MDAAEFDKIADEELHHLEGVLGQLDPDDAEVELSSGVLTITLGEGRGTIVINSHRAAGEIWMAAFRKAWHFGPKKVDGRVEWRTATDELHATLSKILVEKIGAQVAL
jgi:CyaY protein